MLYYKDLWHGRHGRWSGCLCLHEELSQLRYVRSGIPIGHALLPDESLRCHLSAGHQRLHLLHGQRPMLHAIDGYVILHHGGLHASYWRWRGTHGWYTTHLCLLAYLCLCLLPHCVHHSCHLLPDGSTHHHPCHHSSWVH